MMEDLITDAVLIDFNEWRDQWIIRNCDPWKDHYFKYVYKLSSSGTILLYEQCKICGVKNSGSAIKHSDVPNFKEKIKLNEILKYSEELEKNGPTYERYQSEYIDVRRKNKLNEWRSQHGEYLQSNQWKTIRQKVLKRDGFLCQGCLEKPATEVHHKTYENWQNELMFELISVCYDCHHTKIHKK